MKIFMRGRGRRLSLILSLLACSAGAQFPGSPPQAGPGQIDRFDPRPSPSAAPEGDAVMLPPFIVEQGTRTKVWYYLEDTDLEILSTGSDLAAPEFARNYHRQKQILARLIPEKYLWKSELPQILILVEDEEGTQLSDNALRDFFKAQREQAAASGRYVRSIPNLRLVDRDRTVVFATHHLQSRPEYDFGQVFKTDSFSQVDIAIAAERDRLNLVFTTDRIGFLLGNRAPTLPAWFVHGFVELYARSAISTQSISIESNHWRSPADIEALRLESDYPREIIPFPRFFELNPTDLSGAPLRAWREQAALMVRWAMFADDSAHRDALWAYIDRCEVAGRTERSFTRSFGFDYAEARDRVSDFLTEALTQPVVLPIEGLEAPPDYRQRRATPLEVARMRSEWERLEVDYVRRQHPALFDSYHGQVMATLEPARRKLSDTRELDAISGLLEYDLGNMETARSQLESAIGQGVDRPRALQVLAQLRYDELRSRLPSDAHLTLEQIGPILYLLRATLERDPPLPEAYALFGLVWMECESPPSAIDLNHLLTGVRYFPEQPAVIARTAIVLAAQGHLDRAVGVINHGLSFAPDEATRRTYETLGRKLEAALQTAR
ncbi:hypothetical protein [Synoicihabitans lomoniglobus]|uniref:Uncharacterized protein n=1 Tax=Synoicihabitans lomoniglobus TaxID=2909285 RepID=A0AAF0CPR7_9BACT|nr:hypothetical protein [Opitutaceae bacterium LMO-M01]WED65799.1 hypothetical protein PXH66_02925 [Opitutaceae bacterium LMO-M01]